MMDDKCRPASRPPTTEAAAPGQSRKCATNVYPVQSGPSVIHASCAIHLSCSQSTAIGSDASHVDPRIQCNRHWVASDASELQKNTQADSRTHQRKTTSFGDEQLSRRAKDQSQSRLVCCISWLVSRLAVLEKFRQLNFMYYRTDILVLTTQISCA